MAIERVWTRICGTGGTVEMNARDWVKARNHLRERQPWGGSTDEKIAALVEVGAIPYRERYEGRRYA
jgi:hypothetical protein